MKVITGLLAIVLLMAGVGASLSAGVALGQAMAAGLAGASKPPTPAPSDPAAVAGPEVRLAQLKGLLDKGLISTSDFESAKTDILKKLIG